MALCASNPLSTQDDVAAALVEAGIDTYAIKGEDTDTFFKHINAVLDIRPNITMDDGADMVSVLHKERVDQIAEIIGGTEETTTGVIRLRAMAKDGALKYPIVSVNDADTKHLFDNRFGTGQSTIDAIMRATNRLLAGRTIVVCGYGMCGRGVASRARGMGAHVIVTEVDPTAAIEAVMEGYRVMPIRDAARVGDIFITVTGDTSVIRGEHMELMKDGAMLANSGHFDVEIDKARPRRDSAWAACAGSASSSTSTRWPTAGRSTCWARAGSSTSRPPKVTPRRSWTCRSRTRRSRPSGSCSNEGSLEPRVYPVPPEIDKEVARLKLRAMGVEIDELTAGAGSLPAQLGAGDLGVERMDGEISIRAHYERFPATIKGAFVLRGEGRDPQQVRIEDARVDRGVGRRDRSRSPWSRSRSRWRRTWTCSCRSSSRSPSSRRAGTRWNAMW